MRSITILGSTGSIGTQALDVVRRHPERFKIVGLSAAGMNQELLVGQTREFLPPFIAIADENAAADVKAKLGQVKGVEVIVGPDAGGPPGREDGCARQQGIAGGRWRARDGSREGRT